GMQFISFARSEYDENFSGLTYSNFVRDQEPKVWKYYHLSQNFPNPFNPVTKIAYEIPRNEFVKLKVYNSLGEEVITLVDENRSPGRYEIEFDGSSLTSGIYLYRIDAGGFLESHKMILLK
ncbi:MAG TPA: T9SS type A sorting domain-containing protein, partial [Ignavibacteriaceae bacterium]